MPDQYLSGTDMFTIARAEEPSDAILHVTNKLREAVQACDDDKANTRRYTYARFCDDSRIRPINRQIMK